MLSTAVPPVDLMLVRAPELTKEEIAKHYGIPVFHRILSNRLKTSS